MTQQVKVFASKAEDLCSMLGTYMVIRENRVPKVSTDLHMHTET